MFMCCNPSVCVVTLLFSHKLKQQFAYFVFLLIYWTGSTELAVYLVLSVLKRQPQFIKIVIVKSKKNFDAYLF